MSCFESGDGEAIVSASGGAGGFMYQWNDANNQTGTTATNLSAGMITVTATDASGCSIIDSILIIQPDQIQLSIIETDVQCAGGSNGTATVNVNGGSGSYTYSWDDSYNQTTATASNLPAGNYSVTVTDGMGCTAEGTATIMEPTPMTSATNIEVLSCAGTDENDVSVSVSGGGGNYNYIWSDPQNQTTATATDLLFWKVLCNYHRSKSMRNN